MSVFRVVAGLVVVASVAAAGWIGMLQFEESAASNLPIAPVREGEFLSVIPTRGQIQSERSYPVYAPPLVQDLRVSWMAPTGDMIQAGQPMIRFDSSTAERGLIEKHSALEQAQANLDTDIVEAQAAAEHDERDVVDARFNVELAELGTAGNEFVGQIEIAQSEIDLRVAQQKLRQLEAEIEQRVVSRESRAASLGRQLEQAEVEVQIIESQIGGMEILAPQTGYAIYSSSSSFSAMASSGIIFMLTGQGGQGSLRVGSEVSAGMNLATIPDLTSLLIDVTVEEIDRGRMKEGDEVIVRVDALPGISIETTLTGISPLAERSSNSRGRSFHAYASLDEDAGTRLRPGMNGSMDIVIERIPNTLIIPSRSLFTRNGKPTVYVVESEGFRPTEVEVLAQNLDEIAVSGISSDARVTLVDPFEAGGGETSRVDEDLE